MASQRLRGLLADQGETLSSVAAVDWGCTDNHYSKLADVLSSLGI